MLGWMRVAWIVLWAHPDDVTHTSVFVYRALLLQSRPRGMCRLCIVDGLMVRRERLEDVRLCSFQLHRYVFCDTTREKPSNRCMSFVIPLARSCRNRCMFTIAPPYLAALGHSRSSRRPQLRFT
jgi:hypothetical protein